MDGSRENSSNELTIQTEHRAAIYTYGTILYIAIDKCASQNYFFLQQYDSGPLCITAPIKYTPQLHPADRSIIIFALLYMYMI